MTCSSRSTRSADQAFLTRTRWVAAFTLVELLVVIGVIALLISILLPALNKAREQANITYCMANMRGIGQAIDLYVANNKGIMPLIAERNPNTTAAVAGVPNGLTPTSEGYTAAQNGAGRTWAGLLRDFSKVPTQVFRCPSDPRFDKPDAAGFLITGNINNPDTLFSYAAPYVGYNTSRSSPQGQRRLPWSITHIQTGSSIADKGPPTSAAQNWTSVIGPMPKSKIRHPGEIIQVMEGYTPILSTSTGWWPDETTNSGLRGTIYTSVTTTVVPNPNLNVAINVFRHTNWKKDRSHGCNMLFADGHAEARPDIFSYHESNFTLPVGGTY